MPGGALAYRGDAVAKAGIVQNRFRLIRGRGFVVCGSWLDADGGRTARGTCQMYVGGTVAEHLGLDLLRSLWCLKRDPVNRYVRRMDLSKPA